MVRIPDLDEGGHIVEAVARGYQAFFDKFTSGPGVAMPIDLEILAVVAAPKPKGEMTTLTRAGFDARRAKAQGKFFTLAQLKAADGRPLANLLKVNAGALIGTGPNGESFLAARGNATCYAAVVRDGLRVYPFEQAAPSDLDKIFTDDLAAVELYATTPTELKDAGSVLCLDQLQFRQHLLRCLGGGTLYLLGEEGFAWGGHFDECAEARCLLLDRAKKNIFDDN